MDANQPVGVGLEPGEQVLRRAGERFHTRLGWLDSWHSFSFADHHDPAWMGFGPLRVINDDTIAGGAGFGLHPHRNMEIVTVMVAGELEHRDSLGHSERLRAGEVQRMSAGTGLLHSEINPSGAPCRLLQIWIEPNHPGGAASYEQRPFPSGSSWTLLLDPDRTEGAMAIQRQVRLWRAQPGAGEVLTLPCAPGRLAWIQMIAGALEGFAALGPGDGLGWRLGSSQPPMQAGASGADLLLFELA